MGIDGSGLRGEPLLVAQGEGCQYTKFVALEDGLKVGIEALA
jgi:hypothetical protein